MYMTHSTVTYVTNIRSFRESFSNLVFFIKIRAGNDSFSTMLVKFTEILTGVIANDFNE